MFEIPGNRQLVRGTVSVLAVMLMCSVALAQEDVADGSDGSGAIEEVFTDPIDVVIDDGAIGGGGEEVIVVDEGIFVVDPICIECSGEGGDGEVVAYDGVEGELLPEVLYPESECGGCEYQTFGGVAELPVVAGKVRGSSRQVEMAQQPDLCLRADRVAWLCDWQKGALGQ